MIISNSTILKVWAFTSLSLQAQVVAGQDKTAHLRNQKNRQLKNLFAGKSHTPASVNNPNRPDIIARDIPSVDRAKVKAEDAEREARGEPMRFAVANEVTIDTKSDGSWEAIEGDGTQVWRYRLKSPGCNSMNLGFCEYDMPDGGSLHIYDTKGKTAISRPFTSKDNNVAGELWTPLIESCDVEIEVNLPEKSSTDALKLSLCSANVGYRGFGTRPESEHGKPRRELSGSCNIDVVCDEGNDWRAEISSVAAISTGGSLFCSGAMINNAQNIPRPLFLTAYHCGIRSNNAASLVTYWNFETSVCGGNPDGTLDQFSTGSTLLAGSSASDFTLVEMFSDPNPEWEISQAGWDRSGVDAINAIAIHHPSVDEKRISFEYDPTDTTDYGKNTVKADGTHVRVVDWDLGTTEGGSSGSPLFDQNHRIIGQLHGGGAACGNDLPDWYGRIFVSWDAGLSQHLDPTNTGAMFVDTLFSGTTGAPTSSAAPTTSLAPTPSPTIAPEMADFDGTMGTPKCSTTGVACSTGDLLVKAMAGSESNTPNSLDSCSDGTSGVYLTDESVEGIEVAAVGGGMMQAGGQAVVKAKVYAWSTGSEDTADFYVAANPDSPNWELIGSVGATRGGMLTLTSPPFVLPDTPFAAVRVNFRYQGAQSSCSGGSYDDVDDLMFAISQGPPVTFSPTKIPTSAPTVSPSKAPSKQPTLSPETPSPTKSPVTPIPTTATPTTNSPTSAPTGSPETPVPTKFPTDSPTNSPSKKPTSAPSTSPTTSNPTTSPTTSSPTTAQPTTSSPTSSPSTKPTLSPTEIPTSSPTKQPTSSPVTNSPVVACIPAGQPAPNDCPRSTASNEPRCCAGTCAWNGRYAGQCK